MINTKENSNTGVKIFIDLGGKEIARGYLYLLKNDLHERPYGFMEDVFVAEEYRGKGFGDQIVKAIISEAKKRGCYKLLGTSRYGRDRLHQWYTQLGFQDRGKEFRMDL